MNSSLEVHNELQNAPGFEALSYVWGAGEAPAPIICDGLSVSVTSNLYNALQRLRPTSQGPQEQVAAKRRHGGSSPPNPALKDVGNSGISDGLIWIDALCINQNDPIERGQQVGMMGDIFKQAKRVVIWLGSEDAFMPNAACLLSKLSALGPASRKVRHGTVYGYWNKDTSMMAEKGLPHKDAPEWASLREFFMMPWFTRLWVIQEFALASEVGIYIGRYQINLGILERAICNFSKLGLFNVFDEETQSAYWAIDDMFRKDHIWRIRTGKKAKALWDILPQCIWFHCLDPRDRIFALLSLTQEGSTRQIPPLIYPDYTKSLDEVYRDATMYCLSTTRKLQCLGYATPTAGERKRFSWAMNLERELVLTQVCWGNNAANDTCAIVESRHDVGSLCLHGVDVAIVARVSPQIADPKMEPKSKLAAMRAFLDSTDMAVMRPNKSFQQNATDIARALAAGWTPFLRKLRETSGLDPDPLTMRVGSFLIGEISDLSEDDTTDLDHLLWWSRTRKFFITNDGRLGLGPPDLKSGDQVKCLLGGPVLHVLRPQDGFFAYVGDCAMHGLMDGEAIKALVGDGIAVEETDSSVPGSSELERRARLSRYLQEKGLTNIYTIM